MRDYYLTFVSDNVDKMRIFKALADAGLKDFVLTEQINTNNCYSCEYGKKAAYCQLDDAYCDEADINGECACWRASTVAKNETITDDDHSCATCEWYTDGRCLKDCEKHEWFDYCLNHKLKVATTKKIELMEE